MQTSEVDQLAVRSVKPDRPPSVLRAGPLEESVSRNHASLVLERLSKTLRRLDGLSASVDVLESLFAVAHPEVHKAPRCRQDLSILEATPNDPVGICGVRCCSVACRL